MTTLLQNIRYAARQLYRSRSTSLVAILTLGLGIAANTSMFTLANVALVQRAPAVQPDELVWVTSRIGGDDYRNISYPEFADVRAAAQSLHDVSGFTREWFSVGGDVPERIAGELVTGTYFDLLGVIPQRGRLLHAADDGAPGASALVVLSDGFWRRRFGARESIIDSAITINGRPFTVVGVAPPMFDGIEMADRAPMSVWMPMSMLGIASPELRDGLTSRNSSGWLRVMGRMAPGASLSSVSAELSVLSPRLQAARAAALPAGSRRPGAGESYALRASPVLGRFDPSGRAEISAVMGLLMIVPLLVLAVAAANAANVLLARGVARRKEIAMRRALGATRARLVGQLLTESVLLSVAAAALGVLSSYWLTDLITHVGEIPPTIAAVLHPDPRVLGWSLALALGTGVLFGIAPALASTRPDLVPALKDGTPTLAIGKRRHRLRDAFVVAQIAVSLVLLVTAGLFVQSVSKALRVDPGFSARNGVLVSFDLWRQGYTAERRSVFEQRFLDAVRATSGVDGAAFASTMPFGGRFEGTDVTPEGAEQPDGRSAFISSVSPGYFDALGVSFVAGRDFTTKDNSAGARVAIVNETLAKRLWPGQDAMGKRLRVSGAQSPVAEVIGVVRDGKYAKLTESARSSVFLPQTQRPATPLTLIARTSANAGSVLAAIRHDATALDQNLPLYDEATLSTRIHGAADIQRATASMLAVFGALALVLAALGIYGVTAHGVTLRTKEIGIRMSLGARASEVLRLFVGEGLGRAMVGVAIGLGVSAAASKLLSGFLYGLAATDLATFVAGAVVLCGVTTLASYVPARRAARVDPMAALRAD